MVGTWPKPATSKLSLLVRSVKGTGSAAARAAAAGEAGEPSDGGRSCIGASAVGAVGGGIHRCGSLRGAGRRLWTDRSSAGGVQLGRSTVKRATAPTRETYKGRSVNDYEGEGNEQGTRDDTQHIAISSGNLRGRGRV